MSAEWDRTSPEVEIVEEMIATYRWHFDHIAEALRQPGRGKFASDSDVENAFLRWLE